MRRRLVCHSERSCRGPAAQRARPQPFVSRDFSVARAIACQWRFICMRRRAPLGESLQYRRRGPSGEYPSWTVIQPSRSNLTRTLQTVAPGTVWPPHSKRILATGNRSFDLAKDAPGSTARSTLFALALPKSAQAPLRCEVLPLHGRVGREYTGMNTCRQVIGRGESPLPRAARPPPQGRPHQPRPIRLDTIRT